jgi:hypothetical protein
MSCICPLGYTANTSGNFCERILVTAVTTNPTSFTIVSATPSQYWSTGGAVFYEDITNFDFPIKISGSSSVVYSTNNTQLFNTLFWVDQSSNVLSPIVGGPSSGITCTTLGTFNSAVGCICNNCYGPQFLRNNIWGGNGNLSFGRLNNTAIWSNTSPDSYGNYPPLNQWIGFSYCIDIPNSETYYIGLGGEDEFRFRINGQEIVTSFGGFKPNLPAQPNTEFAFRYWSVFPYTFNPGFNVIEVEGINKSYKAGFGVEIYSGSISALTAVTTTSTLSALTIFSSIDLVGQTFDLGENSGYSCPEGYSLVVCDGPPYCAQILQTPCLGSPTPTPTPTITPTPTPTPLPLIFVNECEPITLLSMSATCSIVNLTNKTGSTKSMIVNITGGTPPYTINWSNGSITSGISPQSINNLSAGTYTANIVDYWGDFSATTTCTIPPEAISCKRVFIIPNLKTECNEGLGTGFLDFTINGGTPPYTYSGNVNGVVTTITNPQPINNGDIVNVIITDYNGCVSNVYSKIISCPSTPEPLNCTTTSCPNGNTFVFDISATTISLTTNISVIFESKLSSLNATSVRGSYKISNIDFPNTFLKDFQLGTIARKNYYEDSNGAPQVELSNYLEIGFNQLTPLTLTNSDSPWELIVTPYPSFGGYTQPTPFEEGTILTIEVSLYDEDYCVHKGSGFLTIPNDTLTNTLSISF